MTAVSDLQSASMSSMASPDTGSNHLAEVELSETWHMLSMVGNNGGGEADCTLTCNELRGSVWCCLVHVQARARHT